MNQYLQKLETKRSWIGGFAIFSLLIAVGLISSCIIIQSDLLGGLSSIPLIIYLFLARHHWLVDKHIAEIKQSNLKNTLKGNRHE